MIEVGRVFTRVGFKYDDDGADKFERRTRELRTKARDDIEVDAKVDVDKRGFDQFSRHTRDADRDVDRLNKSSGRLRGAIGGMAKGVGLAGAALGGGLAIGAKKAWEEFEEAAKIGGQTRAVIESTGGAANVTARDVERLAGALSTKAGIDDEVVQKGSNMLLTFKNIRNEVGAGNDIFDQANKALIDMSVALGKDPQQQAIQLGKALNDPIKGISALSRAGVTFTEQQKEQITALVESGRTMDAQKIILRELNSEFGGSAEAQARPLDRAKVAVMNLFEAVGERLAPVIEDAATFLADFTENLIEGEGAAGGVARVVRRIGSAFEWVGGLVKDFIDAFRGGEEGTKRFGKTATGTFQDIKRFVGDAFRTIKGIVRDVAAAFEGSGDSFGKIGKAIASAVGFALGVMRDLLPAVRQIWGGIARVVRGVIDVIAGLLSGDFGRVWDGLKGIVSGAVKAVIGVLRGLATLVWAQLRATLGRVARFAGELVSDGASAARRFVSRIIRFIRDLPGDLWRLFRTALARVGRFARELVSDGVSAGRRFVSAVVNRIKALPGDVWDFLKRALSRVGRFVRDLASDGASAGRRFVSAVVNRVKALPGDVADFLRRTVSRVGGFVGDMASKAGDVGRAAVRGAVNAVKDLPGRVMGFFGNMIDRIRGVPGRILGIFRGIGTRIANAIREAANKLIPDSIGFGPKKVAGKTVIPRVRINIPQLAEGGKVGPGYGGFRAFIAGEGNLPEWVISQEGDRTKNVRWAKEALESLTGKRVGLHALGAGTVTKARGRSREVARREGVIERLQRSVGQLSTRFDLSDEELITEGADGVQRVNRDAVNARADELRQLKDAMTNVRNEIGGLFRVVHDSADAWADIDFRAGVSAARVKIRGSAAAKKRAKKRRAKFLGWQREARDTVAELNEKLYQLGGTVDMPKNGIFPGGDWLDADLERASYEGEEAAVRGTTAPPAAAPPPADPGGGTGGGSDPGTDPGSTPTPPSPEQIATEAAAQLANFTAGREALIAGFGSNFAAVGSSPFGSSIAQAAGLRGFGVDAGNREGTRAGIGGDLIINNNFGGGPANAHQFAYDQERQVSARFG